MFIKRQLAKKLNLLKAQFPVVAVLGPRQSGKTTLTRECFPTYRYINFEELDIRAFASSDPRGFLQTISEEKGVILDEIQHVPSLLSYIQVQVDQKKNKGFFILTGSQNILLNNHINQTLAGRIAILTLLPLSLEELKETHFIPSKIESILLQGFYPSIYSDKVSPSDWYTNYIRTYIERDVRQIQNILDLSLFQKFIKLCAGRTGQLLNLTSLGNDCGISTNTARSWISLLEASYVIFLVQPHHQNFNKRLVKMPKLYFYDTGIACHLLEINSEKDLTSHYLRGGLFESMVLSDLIKQRLNAGLNPNVYFWRDKLGNEVDCILEQKNSLIPIEIKSAETINSSFFEPLTKWNSLSQSDPKNGYIVYAGSENQKRSQGNVTSWNSFQNLNTESTS